MPATEVRNHHPFSPSTLQAREACPKYAPRQTASEAAERGTLQHQVVESGQDNPEVSDEEASAAVECADFLEQRIRGMGEGARVLRECYLPVDNSPLSYRDAQGAERTATCTTAGFADAAIISADGKYAEIFDWKFGRWPVTQAEENLQGIAYVLGLHFRFPTLERVKVFFKQPHLNLVSAHEFSADTFDRLRLRVSAVVARAARASENPDEFSLANFAPSACLFCDNIGRCPVVARFALAIGHKFAPLDIPETVTPSLLRDTKQAALALKCAQLVKTWAEAIRSQTTNAVIAGRMEMPANYELVRRADRYVSDAVNFEKVALSYLTPEQVVALKELGLTKTEKAISAKAARGQKTAVLEEFRARLDESGAIGREDEKIFLKQIAAKE